MHKFNVEDNKRFWAGNKAAYEGAKNASLISFLATAFTKGDILDVGAGDGALVVELKARNPASRVAGIDLAPKKADIDDGDITSLPYQDASFDTVFCTEVIEHLTPEDTEKALNEIERVLRKEGTLILTTPYDEVLEDSIVHCPRCGLSFHRWGHQQSFREKDFLNLAQRHGMSAKHVFPFKFSRVKRFTWLGAKRILNADWMHRAMRKAAGKRHLMMIAGKSGGYIFNERDIGAGP